MMTVLVFKPAQQLLYHMRGINKTAKQSSSDLTCIVECTTPIKRPLHTDNIPFICDKIPTDDL